LKSRNYFSYHHNKQLIQVEDSHTRGSTRDGYLNYSYLSVDRSPYYQKRGYQFEAITVGKDNSIFIGESDRRGKLFIFTPGGIIFDGGLNPKNPR
jgi:hypothetical protein